MLQVGVSAGGWIPRIALGPHTYDGKVWHLSDLVGVLLTLGTPHKSLEAYPFGRKQVSTGVQCGVVIQCDAQEWECMVF